MNNADMPAMPIPITANGRGAIDSMEYRKENGGITKLEHFAGLAPVMPDWFEKKFIASLGSGTEEANEEKAFMAWPVYYAGALLKQLEGESNE